MRNVSQSNDTKNRLAKNESRFLISKPETAKKNNEKTVLRPTFNVVGGIPALVGAWPWMAAIFYNGGKRFLCAGFLIDERHVLTAAHCFINKMSASEYVVRLGHVVANKGSVHRVKAIRVHEQYKPRQYYHDIAVVRLKIGVEFTNKVSPVCLDNLEAGGVNRFDNVTATLLGWGSLTYGQIIRNYQTRNFQFQSEPRRSCRLDNGQRGRCVAINDCPSALVQLRNGVFPEVCYWTKVVPVVCCSQGNVHNSRQPHPTPGKAGNRLERIRPAVCGLRKKGIRISHRPIRKLSLVTAKNDSDTISSGYKIIGLLPPSIGLHNRKRRQALDETKSNHERLSRGSAVGGEPALKGAWPWMASILISGGNRFLCGGFLIDERHVVSAAHCFAGIRKRVSQYKIRLGQINVKEGRLRSVDAVKVHEGFRPRQYYNDIALLRLKNSVTFSDAVAPVCLPDPTLARQNLTGILTTLLGYGDLYFGRLGWTTHDTGRRKKMGGCWNCFIWLSMCRSKISRNIHARVLLHGLAGKEHWTASF
ncbi:coagulation factor X-like [Limulus polyphemus]|uniref:Coagulation factor X-like n=1 Tax=Limulus polyphemus TaxID=6850 RepID=A0ABM1TRZ8_LIMPO|nr:coagulation factor X-like [Limulus polyphemus]